jgi:2-keto-3-deoxy-L-rhamnonate aldolase RhmA
MAPAERRRLAAGRLGEVAVFAFIGSAEAAEVVACSGVDAVIVDREHTAASWETVADMVRAVQGRSTTALVRVRDLDAKEIAKALDIGADGVLVPHVSSADDVRVCAQAVDYPPTGSRSYCGGTRGEGWGLDGGEGRSQPILGVLVEDRGAVEAIGDLLGAGERVDFLLVGARDLSLSMGEDMGGAAVQQALRTVAEAVRDRPDGERPVLGIVAGSARERSTWGSHGYDWFVAGIDLVHLGTSVKATAQQLRGLPPEAATR